MRCYFKETKKECLSFPQSVNYQKQHGILVSSNGFEGRKAQIWEEQL